MCTHTLTLTLTYVDAPVQTSKLPELGRPWSVCGKMTQGRDQHRPSEQFEQQIPGSGTAHPGEEQGPPARVRGSATP